MKISNNKTLLFIQCLCILALMACQSKPKENKGATESKTKPLVIAVNYPLYYFAKQIAGDLIDLQFPVDPDVDPAFWQPDEQDIELIQKADIILLNGADYAKWVKAISLPSGRLKNTSIGFQDQYIKTEGKTHSHGPGGEHSHAETAITTWLDFKLAEKQAKAMLDILVKMLPEAETELHGNFDILKNNIKSLDEAMIAVAGKYQDQVVLASHPVYQYLEAGYGLQIKSFHLEPKEKPTNHDWAHLVEAHQKQSIELMLWEGEPLASTSSKLNEIGLKTIVFDPCGNKPAQDEWLTVMKKNIEALNAVKM